MKVVAGFSNRNMASLTRNARYRLASTAFVGTRGVATVSDDSDDDKSTTAPLVTTENPAKSRQEYKGYGVLVEVRCPCVCDAALDLVILIACSTGMPSRTRKMISGG